MVLTPNSKQDKHPSTFTVSENIALTHVPSIFVQVQFNTFPFYEYILLTIMSVKQWETAYQEWLNSENIV